MNKTLDEKLARIHAGTATRRDFILSDAKDADMAFGVTAPGPQPGKCRHGYHESEGCWRTLPDYLEQIRGIIRQGIVDIVLLSASNLERLAIREKMFKESLITPAARANDTSDIGTGDSHVRRRKFGVEVPQSGSRHRISIAKVWTPPFRSGAVPPVPLEGLLSQRANEVSSN